MSEHHDLTRLNITDDAKQRALALHARCHKAWGPPIDLAAALLDLTQSRRWEFVGGGGSSTGEWGGDQIDAIVHAAAHGYRLCMTHGRRYSWCWLPEGHDGDHADDNGFLWRFLYGQKRPARLVCATCTPHRRDPVPDDCPHVGPWQEMRRAFEERTGLVHC